MNLAQQLDDLVLGVVGVLELVHQYLAEAFLIGLPHIVARLQQVGRHHQEVVEIKCIRRQQALLIFGIDIGDLALERVVLLACRFPEGLEVDELGLGLADHGGDGARRETFRIEPHL